jgi:hypothetical protein
MQSVLFALTEYNAAASIVFYDGVEMQAPFVEPALRAFPVREAEAIPTARVSIDARTVVELRPASVEASVGFDADRAVRGDFGGVERVLVDAARDLASARLAYMKRALDQVTEATGQVARVSRQLTWDGVMAAIEPLDIGFDADGSPTFQFWPPPAQQRSIACRRELTTKSESGNCS